MARDWRDDRIEEQARQIAALIAQVNTLTARVADLEEKLRKSSHNSSKPPSSDGPKSPPRAPKTSTGRKPGGREGHEKHDRPLVPPEKVSKCVVLRPTRCRGCGHGLVGDDQSPHRHQVFELPRVEPIVTEYQLHSLECACGVTTRAELPPDVPAGAFGPSVSATVAVLMGVYRLSKRAVPALMRDLFGLTMSVGMSARSLAASNWRARRSKHPSRRREPPASTRRSSTPTRPDGARLVAARSFGPSSPRSSRSSWSTLAATPTPRAR